MKLVVSGNKIKNIEELYELFEKISSKTLAYYFSESEIVLEKLTVLKLLKERLDDKVNSISLDDSINDEYKRRVKYYDKFTLFNIVNMVATTNVEFDFDEFKKVFIKKCIDVIVENTEKENILSHKLTKLLSLNSGFDGEADNLLEFMMTCKNFLVDSEDYIDGLYYIYLHDAIIDGSTLAEIKGYAEFNNINLPRRLKKNELIQVMKFSLKRRNIELTDEIQERFSKTTNMKLQFMAKEFNIPGKIEMKKEGIFEFILKFYADKRKIFFTTGEVIRLKEQLNLESESELKKQAELEAKKAAKLKEQEEASKLAAIKDEEEKARKILELKEQEEKARLEEERKAKELKEQEEKRKLEEAKKQAEIIKEQELKKLKEQEEKLEQIRLEEAKKVEEAIIARQKELEEQKAKYNEEKEEIFKELDEDLKEEVIEEEKVIEAEIENTIADIHENIEKDPANSLKKLETEIKKIDVNVSEKTISETEKVKIMKKQQPSDPVKKGNYRKELLLRLRMKKAQNLNKKVKFETEVKVVEQKVKSHEIVVKEEIITKEVKQVVEEKIVVAEENVTKAEEKLNEVIKEDNKEEEIRLENERKNKELKEQEEKLKIEKAKKENELKEKAKKEAELKEKAKKEAELKEQEARKLESNKNKIEEARKYAALVRTEELNRLRIQEEKLEQIKIEEAKKIEEAIKLSKIDIEKQEEKYKLEKESVFKELDDSTKEDIITEEKTNNLELETKIKEVNKVALVNPKEGLKTLEKEISTIDVNISEKSLSDSQKEKVMKKKQPTDPIKKGSYRKELLLRIRMKKAQNLNNKVKLESEVKVVEQRVKSHEIITKEEVITKEVKISVEEKITTAERRITEITNKEKVVEQKVEKVEIPKEDTGKEELIDAIKYELSQLYKLQDVKKVKKFSFIKNFIVFLLLNIILFAIFAYLVLNVAAVKDVMPEKLVKFIEDFYSGLQTIIKK